MRLLHYCGLPIEDVEFINSDGKTMNKLLLEVGSKYNIKVFAAYYNLEKRLLIAFLHIFAVRQCYVTNL